MIIIASNVCIITSNRHIIKGSVSLFASIEGKVKVNMGIFRANMGIFDSNMPIFQEVLCRIKAYIGRIYPNKSS